MKRKHITKILLPAVLCSSILLSGCTFKQNKTQENKSLLNFDIILPRFVKEVRSENTMKNNRTFTITTIIMTITTINGAG